MPSRSFMPVMTWSRLIVLLSFMQFSECSAANVSHFQNLQPTQSQLIIGDGRRQQEKKISTDDLPDNSNNKAEEHKIADYTADELAKLKAERKQKKKERKKRKKAKDKAAKKAGAEESNSKEEDDTADLARGGDVSSNDYTSIVDIDASSKSANNVSIETVTGPVSEATKAAEIDDKDARVDQKNENTAIVKEKPEEKVPTREKEEEAMLRSGSIPTDQTGDSVKEIESSEEAVQESEEEEEEEELKLITHDIDGYGTITSCDEESGATDDYESMDLEIDFEYQLELISADGEQPSYALYPEKIAATERAVHNTVVEALLDCEALTQSQGITRLRRLLDREEQLLRVVGVSSAPQDTISLSETCTSAHTTDACVVIHATTIVTLAIEQSALNDSSNDAHIVMEKNDIRTNVLSEIETAMSQGKFDKRYGTGVFAKLSFSKRTGAEVMEGSTSMWDNTTAASLRGETNIRNPRRNVRLVVIISGLCLIVLVFKLISYNKDMRSNRRPPAEDTSESTRDDGEGSKHMPSLPERNHISPIIIEEEEEAVDNTEEVSIKENDFEENERRNEADTSVAVDIDEWTYDGMFGSQDLENGETNLSSPACVSHFRAIRDCMYCNKVGRGDEDPTSKSSEVRKVSFEEAWGEEEKEEKGEKYGDRDFVDW